MMVLAAVVLPGRSAAAQVAPASVGLGTADNFAVLGGQGVTNTGPTTVNGDLGTWPNPSITGAGLTVNGTIHAADAVARQAQAATTTAYNAAAGRTPVTSVATELGGRTLTAGNYSSSAGTFGITGTVTLDAQGDPNAVFVFQASSTLTTGSRSTVNLINGAAPCNVFWQVGSSATLGTYSTFRGTILALASITVTTGVTLEGRALARNGAVTLDTDTITRATCAPPEATGTTVSSSASPTDAGSPVTFTATVTSPGGTPKGSVTYLDNGTPLTTVPLGSSGQATYTTSGLTSGSHTITAVYLGGPGFENSTSTGITQVVEQIPAPTTTRPSTTTTAARATTTTTAGAVTTGGGTTGGGTTGGGTTDGGSGLTSRSLTTPPLAETGPSSAGLVAAALAAIALGSTMIVGSRRSNR